MIKQEKVEFTKLQQRLLRTIKTKHNQAMAAEIGSALLDIYAELGHNPESGQLQYRLREDLSGLDLVLPAPSFLKEEKIDA